METQHVSMNGDSAHDDALPVKLVINKHIEAVSKVCDGLRGDAVFAEQEVASIVCAKLLMEDHVVSTRCFHICEERCFP